MLRPLLLLALVSGSASAQAHFTDVTLAAGIRYRQATLPLGLLEMPQMTGGACAGDFDGDGWVDLFVTRMDEAPILYRNRGQNTNGAHLGFEDVSAAAFGPDVQVGRLNGAAAADVDGDGDLDLYVTGLWTAQFFLYINDGAGHFTEEAAARGAALMATSQFRGFSASFGDYDRDGDLDLFTAEWGHLGAAVPGQSSHTRLLRNLGPAQPGYFEDVTDAAGVALEGSQASGPSGSWLGVFAFTPRFADFDDDGWPELAVAGDFNTSRLFWNDGDGTFTDGTLAAGVGTDQNGMGATIADLNGDGRLDWFVTAIYDPIDTCAQGQCNWGPTGNRLFLNAGQRQFVDGTDLGVRDGGWGWGTTSLDYDNDAIADLAMTNGIEFPTGTLEDPFNHDVTRLWRGNGTGFDDVGVSCGIQDSGSGKGLLWLDYDRDGDQDLYVVNTSESPVLYRNDGGNNLHWLQLELQGAGLNTHAIGARVKVWRNGVARPQVQEMSASSNYLSQNEPLLHFGLGRVERVSRIEVRWPGGATTVVNDVACDQRLTLIEP